MVRIWDSVPVEWLCRNHLLGEHKELHAIWATLVGKKKGCSRHPEALRWTDHLPALVRRHEEQVAEMYKRGYKHRSPLLSTSGIIGKDSLPTALLSFEEQVAVLLERSRTRETCQCSRSMMSVL